MKSFIKVKDNDIFVFITLFSKPTYSIPHKIKTIWGYACLKFLILVTNIVSPNKILFLWSNKIVYISRAFVSRKNMFTRCRTNITFSKFSYYIIFSKFNYKMSNQYYIFKFDKMWNLHDVLFRILKLGHISISGIIISFLFFYIPNIDFVLARWKNRK